MKSDIYNDLPPIPEMIYLSEYQKLQEENKRLKEYQESYRKELDYWRIQFSNNKDRIDKAIEYIEQVNKDKDQVPYLTEGETLKLLDILRGLNE